ncbi:MAG: signal peptidase I, partial [Candidatus Harrisonbacteria bacterium]|nr:signal peptidase I [Candidatus Harrisonbacteria bacterium]
MKQFFLASREILEVVVISLMTVYIVRSFIIQPFLVSGASMEPTFSDGNYLLIDELTYRFRAPERGEVIVFRYPGDAKTF